MATLIVGADYIKTYYEIDESMDDGYITPVIEQAQETTVQDLLGSDQYDQFISDIDAYVDSGTAIPTNLTNIRPYLEKILAYEVISRLVVTTTFKITAQGAVTKSGDNNTALTERELTRLKNTYRRKSDAWRHKLWRYLCEYSSSYPLWQSPTADALICPHKPYYRTGLI